MWSPIALTTQLTDALDAIGPVAHIVSPNKLHHLFLPEWRKRWPQARFYAPPGLAAKKTAVRFDAELGDLADSSWSSDLDQTVFRGSFALSEVVFFHRASRTAIFGDLIQRFPQAAAKGWTGLLMQLGGIVGEHGSTPRDWRLSFLSHTRARAAKRTVLAWKPQRLVVAHGECAASGADEIIAAALKWI